MFRRKFIYVVFLQSISLNIKQNRHLLFAHVLEYILLLLDEEREFLIP